MARTSHGSSGGTHGGNCVAYARDLTGVHIDGNAATWWPHAEGRYQRGRQPAIGSILVFKPRNGMRSGHVAVVSQIVGPREILLDHANWVRGRVTKAMSAIDASPHNDWTIVKLMELHSHTHGRENATFGFIYPASSPAGFDQAVAEAATQSSKHRAASHKERRAGNVMAKTKPAEGADQPAKSRHAAERGAKRHRVSADRVVAVY